MRTLFLVVLLISVLALPVFAGTWHALAPIPVAEGNSSNHALAYDNNGHLFATGSYVGTQNGNYRISSEFFKYDIQTNSWAKMSNSPDGTEWNTAVSVGNDRIIVSRGYKGSPTMYNYNISADSWSILEPFPGGYFGYNAGVFDGNNSVYYTGGGSLWRYGVSGNNWSKLRDLPEGFFYNSMAYSGNGKLYCTVGRANDQTPSNHFYEYDIVRDTWTWLSDIPTSIIRGTLAPDGRGGFVLGAGGGTSDPLGMYRYDIASDTWTRFGNSPAVFGGNAVAFDGIDSIYYTAGNGTADFYRYDMDPVPEPSSLIALGVLLTSLLFRRRR